MRARRALGPMAAHSSDPFCERDGEEALGVDALLDFAETGCAHEFVQLFLGAPAHDPRRACAMAGERARDELDLRMPGLAGVDQMSAGFDGGCEAGESF